MSSILFSLGVHATEGLPGEIYSSIILMCILLIFCIVVKIKAHFTDPLKRPKGIVFIAETYVGYIDSLVEENMGKQFKFLSPYFGFLAAYIFGSFLIGVSGLPSPLTFYWIPFMLALVTFLMINITSLYYNKWKYFKQFVFPIPIVGIFSLFAPLLSLSLRLFAHALAGWIMLYLVYSLLENLSAMIFGGLPFFIAPFITPILHMYFDLFSGFIQTTVFVLLSMLFISNEVPDAEDLEQKVAVVAKD